MKALTKVLFLCTGNSCRSQMAEGFLRHYFPEDFAAYSAGIKKQGLNPLAAQVMEEIGIDINKQFSKTTAELQEEFDFVVTVCDNAKETCPYFPAKTKLFHHSFPDPPALTKEMSDPEEVLKVYRKVRDQIKDYILTFPQEVKKIL